jgi:1-aminocyclopropane-1-carboxylate deaminase/D-cysteine desulfhydrase-like pyridoxal-dependent ACC family enzyme
MIYRGAQLRECTATYPLGQVSKSMEVEIRAKREDCFPYYGGGNKARIVHRIGKNIIGGGYTAVVTTGAVYSNHARATALFAKENGLCCRLVLHGDPVLEYPRVGNLLAVTNAGAWITIVRKEQITREMDRAMDELQKSGHKPLYIRGGGYGIEGTTACVEAFRETVIQCTEDQWIPQYIVVPSGSGTTQAGILIGVAEARWNTKIIGVSIARNCERGRDAVSNAIQTFSSAHKVSSPLPDLDFRDRWTGGGYGETYPELLDIVKWVADTDGLNLDPVYTGKAFTALRELVRSNEIPRGSRILFWHTGGLPNQ